MTKDYDLNIFVREEYNSETKSSYWNTDQWYIHVYDYKDGTTAEASEPFLLTKEESFCLNFEEVGDIDKSLDGWMSLDYFLDNYKEQASERILNYLERFTK